MCNQNKHLLARLRKLAQAGAMLLAAAVFTGRPAEGALSIIDLNTITADQLANSLKGVGILDVANASFIGDNRQAGTFSGGTGIVGIESGVILSTGKAADVVGVNTSTNISTNLHVPGDPDVETYMVASSADAAVLEFDFIPAGDKVFFRFVFGSEEYESNLQFADTCVAIFNNQVNGINVPGTTTHVSVGTINQNVNSAYYKSNLLGTYETKLNGITLSITGEAQVNPGTWNHAKIVIGDYVNAARDSALFVEYFQAPCKDAPPRDLAAVKEGAECGDLLISLAWLAPEGCVTVAGYNVYRDGNRLNSALLTASFYVDSPSGVEPYDYVVEAMDVLGVPTGSAHISSDDAVSMLGWPYGRGNRTSSRSSPVDIAGGTENPGLNEQWSLPGQGFYYFSPLIDRFGTIYTTMPPGLQYLNAIDPDGNIKWTMPYPVILTLSLVDPEGGFYGVRTTESGSEVFALPKHDGPNAPQVKWTIPMAAGSGRYPHLILPDGSLLMGGADHELPVEPPPYLQSINTSDGSVNWTVEYDAEFLHNTAVDCSNRLFMGGRGLKSGPKGVKAFQLYPDGSPAASFSTEWWTDHAGSVFVPADCEEAYHYVSDPVIMVTPEADWMVSLLYVWAAYTECEIESVWQDPSYLVTSVFVHDIDASPSDPLSGEVVSFLDVNVSAGLYQNYVGMAYGHISSGRHVYMGCRHGSILDMALDPGPSKSYFPVSSPDQYVGIPAVSADRWLAVGTDYPSEIIVVDLETEEIMTSLIVPYRIWNGPAIGPNGEWYVTDYNSTIWALGMEESTSMGGAVVESSATNLPVYLYTISDSGEEGGGLKSPQGVAATDGGYIAVADTGNSRVKILTDEGKLETKVGRAGRTEGNFMHPEAVAVAAGADGLFYVADTRNSRIQVFRDDEVLFAFGKKGSGEGEFDSPGGVAVSEAGRVFVADTGNDRMQVFTETGEFVLAFGEAGSGRGRLDGPAGVAVNKAGEVFVADKGNRRIQVFTQEGKYLRMLEPREGLDAPSGVAVGPEDALYVSTAGHQVVVLDNESGKQLGVIGGYGSAAGKFDSPNGLAWNLSGQMLYIADTGNDRVEVYGYRQASGAAASGRAAERPASLALPAGALPSSEPSGTGPTTTVPGEEPITPPAPGQLALQGLVASPNPFDPRSGEVLAVSFGVNMGASVKLVIRDRFGRIAYESATQEVQAGSVLLEWNGRTMGGTYAPPGAYAVSVEAVAGGESVRAGVEVTVATKGEGGPVQKGSPRERARTQGK